jgi:hypothetical protein
MKLNIFCWHPRHLDILQWFAKPNGMIIIIGFVDLSRKPTKSGIEKWRTITIMFYDHYNNMELIIYIKRSINSKTKILVVLTKSKGIIQRIGMGASTVKRTTPDPCLVSSKKYSQLHTNFEFL